MATTAEELLILTNAMLAAKADFISARTALQVKDNDALSLVTSEAAALELAQTAYDAALESAYATVGRGAANDAYTTAANVLDAAQGALTVLVPTMSLY